MYVIWDKFDNIIHRGPWSEQKCLKWMEKCRTIMPSAEGVDKVFEIRHIEELGIDLP